MHRLHRLVVFACFAALTGLLGCHEETDSASGPITFGEPGAPSGAAGRGSFTFGAASAAAQIEDQNPYTDWHLWTAPPPAGLGRGTDPVGEASRGFSMALQDVDLLSAINLDAYRFSIGWSRVEPARDQVDATALGHYGAFIDALVARGIKPMITVHHFSSPVWVDDPRDPDCPAGPTDANLCGWQHPQGGPLIIEELAEHARRLATEYGDRVDEWCTVNEPINYLLASYGLFVFPPGRNLILSDFPSFMDVIRNYVAAHVAIYEAIHEADTIDADGDGIAASVGFTLSVAEWSAARDNRPSDRPEDIAAADRWRYFYHYLFPESLRQGAFDADLDQTFEESHPEWAGKLDWLGVQYYFRAGVSAQSPVVPGLDLVVCAGGLDLGSCLPAEDPTHWIPEMHYEFWAPGLYHVLRDFGTRWPDLPLTVTESGLATESGRRRAEHVVRSLEQIARARDEGVDVRGYYHWSLYDNFEWSEGFGPRFGLYRVDYAGTYARTPTEGATVLGEIAGARRITAAQRAEYGGLGPMTEEP